jgi:lysophospholipase L1-like esterase
MSSGSTPLPVNQSLKAPLVSLHRSVSSGLTFWFALVLVIPSLVVCRTAFSQVIQAGNRVVFLGDSNTYAGTWVDLIDAWQHKEQPSFKLELLNLGLSSETACGLSEPGHPFPRPDVRERLDRALTKLKPDVVFVCYGMNDGIYHPLKADRFEAYQAGLREVCGKIRKSGAKVVLMTPPPFDPLPLKKQNKLASPSNPSAKFSWQIVAEDYDKTIATYAKWVKENGREIADQVIDVHTPLTSALMEGRKSNPDFAFSGDGVHFDGEGHRLMAKAVLASFGHDHDLRFDAKYLDLVSRKQRLLRDAYLSDVGHKRPGLPEGKPISEARSEAEKIEAELMSFKP